MLRFRRVAEKGVDFLEAAVSFDGGLALGKGADKFMKDRTRPRSLLKFVMGIANFEKRGWTLLLDQ